MAQQRIYKQPGERRNEEDPYADDQGWTPTHDFQRSSGLSNDASNTIGNIDALLAEQEAEAPAIISRSDSDTLKRDGDKKGDDATELKDGEEKAPDRSGFSAGEDIKEKLGQGYTGKGSKQSKGLSKLYGSNSKLKKKIALAGAAAGGSALVSLLVFLALIPLKIETFVKNLEGHYNAAADQAISSEADNLFSSWVTKEILPNLHKGVCHTTVDPGCVSVADGSGPFSKLYNGWRDGKLEQKLAKEHGIVFAAKGNTYYMTVNGKDFNIHSDNIFNFTDSEGHAVSQVTRNDIRTAVRTAVKEGTLWDKVYTRFKYGKLLESKYGIKRCIIACNIRDKFTDKIADKKLAAKAYIVSRVISPLSESYGLIIQCVMSGGCDTDLSSASSDNPTRASSFQEKLQDKLTAYAAGDTEKLASLISKANDISKGGFTKYIAQQIGEAIGGEVGGQVGEKAVPFIGWALLVGQLVEIGGNLGPMVQHAGYAANVSAAVQLYGAYNTVASEVNSGHMDPTELGSFNDALSSNLSGTTTDSSDATNTPLYGELVGGSGVNSASIFGSIFGGTITQTDHYTCDNGSQVPAGQLVCSEEQLAKGNEYTTDISNAINGITGAVPGFDWLLKGINTANKALGEAFAAVFNPACKVLGVPFTDYNCEHAVNYLGGKAADLMNFIMHKLIVSPITDNMSGGRTFDMMAAGADASYANSCQTNLGCPQASPTTMATIQNQQVAEAKQSFNSQSAFARVFSTASPYSLVSRLAVDMPGSTLTANTGFLGSLLLNPLSRLSSGFGNLFTAGSNAFAASQSQADPFGIPQAGWSDDQINAFNQYVKNNYGGDYDQYWSTECADPSNPLQLDQTKLAAWMNDPSNVREDSNTGTPVFIRGNQCLLAQSSFQSLGGVFDSSLLPTGSTSSDTSTSPTTSSNSGVSGDATTLAKQVLANTNITLQKDCVTGPTAEPRGCAYQDILATSQGQQVTPGKIEGNSGLAGCSARTPVTLDPMLLQAMLNIAAKYSYTIQDVTSGHSCDSGRHPLGRAFDIFAVNGIPIDGNCDSSPIRGFAQNVASIMSALRPTGSPQNGIGACDQAMVSPIPANINYFIDSSDQLHVDTGTP